jgi:formiminotetrahydrofolate cyclodeaminase
VTAGPPSLLELPARELLDRFASSQPTPGGGSAAALAGALGAALAAMVSAMPKTRTGAPEERTRLDAALRQSQEAGARLRQLVDEDTAAYEAVLAAYRMPRVSEEERSARKSAVDRAMERATVVPLETAKACVTVLDAAVEAAAHGNANALSDARTAGALGLAGLLGAVENVRINAQPGSLFLETASVLRQRGLKRVADLGVAFASQSS